MLLACRCAPPQDSADPWADWPAVPVDDFRFMLRTELELTEPRALVVQRQQPLSFVLQQGSTRVLDARHEHGPSAACLPAWKFPAVSESGERQGDCQSGEVELNRGVQPRFAALAISPDGETGWGVSGQGLLHRLDLDPLQTHPWDWLRAVEVTDLGLSGVSSASLVDGVLWVGTDQGVFAVDLESLEVQQLLSLPEGVQVMEGDLVGTTTGLTGGLDLPGIGSVEDIEEAADGVWVALGEGGLRDPGGGIWQDDSVWRIAGLGEALYAVGDAGLWRFEDEEAELLIQGELLDVATLPSFEVLVLDAQGVEVYVDERPLLEGPPLGIHAQTFLEKPRSPDEDAPCTGDVSVRHYVGNAVRNRRLLAEMPGTTALDITPHYARRVQQCQELEPLEALLALDRVEFGVLVHETSGCGADQACVADFLEAGAQDVAGLGVEPLHWSGMAPMWDDGEDWVAALEGLSVPAVVGFQGMSVLDAVPHGGDPRAKEGWPLGLHDWQPWSAATAADAGHDVGGPVRFVPSDSRAAFSYEGCGTLLLRECFVLGRGAGQELSERDLAQLDLSLHRALAMRAEGSIWSYHLPDLGSWDYATGCDEDWEGDCDGAALRAWWIDVHARWVQNGAAQWALPSTVMGSN